MAKIVWINGAFASGKTHTAYEIRDRLSSRKVFVYDPENAGFYLRKNLPNELQEANFQDHAEWRRINNLMLKRLAAEYDGTVLIPMTVTNPSYWQEITQGVEINFHILLETSMETLQKRIKRRTEGPRSFASQMSEHCLDAFSSEFGEAVPNLLRVPTDSLPISEVAEAVARLCGLTLDPRGGKLPSAIRHLRITLQHIR